MQRCKLDAVFNLLDDIIVEQDGGREFFTAMNNAVTNSVDIRQRTDVFDF